MQSYHKYVDIQFPPVSRSIFKHGLYKSNIHLIFSNLQRIFIDYKWSRPENLRIPGKENNLQLCLYNNPQPSGVVQGHLSSCWHLSALSALTTNAYFFAKLFNPSQLTYETYRPINTQGFYQFRMCVRGIWENVTIDDYLPNDITNKLVFTKLIRGQLYPALIEKALAKIHGSYDSIAFGTCASTHWSAL